MSLALTALEQFWDTSKHVVFLGPWCTLYSRRHVWERLDAEMLPDVWDDPEGIDVAAQRCERLIESTCRELGKRLDQLHGEEHGERYWRIVLGGWLTFYVPGVIDRLASLQAAFTRWPEITTLVLSPESFVTPADTAHYVALERTDAYNLQLYSRILSALGREYPDRPALIEAEADVMPRNESFLRRLSAVVERHASVVLKSSYLPRRAELRIGLQTAGRVWPDVHSPSPIADTPLDSDFRAALVEPAGGDDEQACILSTLLPIDLPRAYVEDYRALGDRAAAVFPATPHAIFSCNAWYFDEAFKRWAASSAEHGTLLLGSQHGGNYGCLANHASEDHELRITDRYYTWGWVREGADTRPMPATKLVGRPELGASGARRGILLTLTEEPRYLNAFVSTPSSFVQYLEWHRTFVLALPGDLRGEVRARFHRLDAGWDVRQRLQDSTGVSADSNGDFLESLAACRVYVADHLATSYAEALAADVPTVLFWDRRHTRLRPEAEPVFDALREGGILFHDPEQAADAVAEAYADVENWWAQPRRREARAEFCDRFARTSTTGAAEWSRELGAIASHPS